MIRIALEVICLLICLAVAGYVLILGLGIVAMFLIGGS